VQLGPGAGSWACSMPDSGLRDAWLRAFCARDGLAGDTIEMLAHMCSPANSFCKSIPTSSLACDGAEDSEDGDYVFVWGGSIAGKEVCMVMVVLCWPLNIPMWTIDSAIVWAVAGSSWSCPCYQKQQGFKVLALFTVLFTAVIEFLPHGLGV